MDANFIKVRLAEQMAVKDIHPMKEFLHTMIYKYAVSQIATVLHYAVSSSVAYLIIVHLDHEIVETQNCQVVKP